VRGCGGKRLGQKLLACSLALSAHARAETQMPAALPPPCRCHVILANLRPAGNKGYVIPRGFLFNTITCPNYTGESVSVTGYGGMGSGGGGLQSTLVYCCSMLVAAAAAQQQQQHALLLPIPGLRCPFTNPTPRLLALPAPVQPRSWAGWASLWPHRLRRRRCSRW
jgi:hypothetical protein